MLSSILTWRHRGWRAVFYGLACAYKQVPWLLAPFILVRLLIDDQDRDPRSPLGRALAFFAVAGAVFAVVNGPFMLADFPAWAAAVVQPLSGQLVYLGSGLASTTQFGLVDLPKEFYATASLAVTVTLLLLYTAHFQRWRHTLWLFPGLMLWFSYRSLQSYFVYWVPLLLATLVVEATGRRGAPRSRPHGEARSPGGRWDRLNRLPLRARPIRPGPKALDTGGVGGLAPHHPRRRRLLPGDQPVRGGRAGRRATPFLRCRYRRHGRPGPQHDRHDPEAPVRGPESLLATLPVGHRQRAAVLGSGAERALPHTNGPPLPGPAARGGRSARGQRGLRELPRPGHAEDPAG